MLGICVLLYLDNGIDSAAWLTADERSLLNQGLAREAATKRDHSLRMLFSIPTLWLFTTIYLLIVMGVYGINFWLPSIIQQTGVRSVLSIGWITAASYFVSAVLAVTISRRAERRNEKRWHAATAAALGGAGLALSAAFADNTWLPLPSSRWQRRRAHVDVAVLELPGLDARRSRRGRGSCSDQLGRQSRRLHRPLSARRIDAVARQLECRRSRFWAASWSSPAH